jgi:integrase/recombinase XerD
VLVIDTFLIWVAERRAIMGDPLRVRVTGPLRQYVPGFAAELAGLGYSAGSASVQVGLMAHLSRWLAGEGLDAAGLTPQVAGRFLAARRAAGYTKLLSAGALVPLLGYLQRLGAVSPAGPVEPGTPAEVLLGRYRDYLAGERVLAASTIGYYMAEARLFVSRVAGPDLGGLAGLAAAGVSGFVAAECRCRGTGSAKILVTALRSFLRFLFLDGWLAADLAAAVPAVAGWRGAGLPKALPAGDVAALLGSCDRQTAAGRRDFAVLLLLARLGLRACEVAALGLDDISWRAGEIVIRGKGRREERMPLPADVGEALAGYLRGGRPAGACSRAVFLRVRAPAGPLSVAGVKEIVRHACGRAGLAEAGPHRLRHAAAVQMLRAGSPLAEVGQVLRHRSVATTAIYAKVDHAALAALALPWPGSRP